MNDLTITPTAPDPVLAELVLSRILMFAADERVTRFGAMIRELAAEDTALLSPHLRNEFIDKHIAAYEWWLSLDWRTDRQPPVFVYDTPEGEDG
ncbi:hypothetical protein ACPPVQ_10795 [Diaminobutyricibacter sp. McL0618]|uniref:hypothetical protein n=1 Tax=Leifsonia sp. McL0618 TaxID=3415677 RepID=UPI003CEB665B